MNRAGAQKWKQIGCDSESPLPVMRKSKRHPRVSSSKMAHSKKFNFMSQLLACIHKFNIFRHLSTIRLSLLQLVRPSNSNLRLVSDERSVLGYKHTTSGNSSSTQILKYWWKTHTYCCSIQGRCANQLQGEISMILWYNVQNILLGPSTILLVED